MQYIVASDLDEAIRLRQETGYTLLAGGTDVYPALEGGLRVPGLIDISRIPALAGGITLRDGVWVIPALTSWTEVVQAELPPQFDMLKQAAVEVGGRQIQNTGTVGGNICNASPAADGIVALMALEARVVLAGPAGQREVPIEAFVLGNRRIDLGAGELLCAIHVPARGRHHASIFRKLGARRYLVISIVMAGVLIELGEMGTIRSATIAVGACAERALRLRDWERSLVGQPLRTAARASVSASALAPLHPIDDIRASASYRKHAAEALIRDALKELAGRLA